LDRKQRAFVDTRGIAQLGIAVGKQQRGEGLGRVSEFSVPLDQKIW
jgi:hypothetical protein